MRPPEFTGGNDRREPTYPALRPDASMRPPEFTGGNGSAYPVDWGEIDRLQ